PPFRMEVDCSVRLLRPRRVHETKFCGRTGRLSAHRRVGFEARSLRARSVVRVVGCGGAWLHGRDNRRQFLTHLLVYTRKRFDLLQVIVMGALNLRVMGPLLIVGSFAAYVAVRRPVSHGRHRARAIRTTLKNSRLRWGIASLVCYFAVAVLVSAPIS